MKIRIVKKALKAFRQGRFTPLLRKVRLSHVCFLCNIRNKFKYELWQVIFLNGYSRLFRL